MTMSASPARIGATSFAMSPPKYWLSASVLTITSAPSLSEASRPAWKPEARPLLLVSRTMWSTPCRRAASIVRSVETSSTISHSTVSKPCSSRGMSASVTGRVSSSFGQGIWMMSFMARPSEGTARRGRRYRDTSMEGATLTRRRPGSHGLATAGRARVAAPAWLARTAFLVLCAGALIGFFVYPTYPNYDSYYSLLWGREVLDLQAPTFEGFRIPTEHPLAIVAGAALSLLGRHGDRVFVLAILASYLWLVAGVYRLGRTAFTPLIGAIAAVLL